MTAAESIRHALTRKALATARHRAAAARLLGLGESELLAVQHLGVAGRLTPSALGARLRLTSGGTTALVHRLERAGHVTRAAHPGDGRSTLLRLTAATEARAAEAFAPLVAELDALVEALPERDRDVVDRFLRGVADAAERHADAAARAADERERAAIGEPVPGLWS